MDSQTESGCKEAPAPGVGQGCAGGQVPPGGGEVLSGQAPPVLRVKDVAYLRWKGDWLRVIVEEFRQFGGAISVSNGNGEYICERKDLITEAEHLAKVYEENRQMSAREHSRVLDAWSVLPPEITKTKARNKWLAEQCGITAREAAGAVRSLAHWKLIELPKEEVKEKPEYRALLDEVLKHRFRYYVQAAPTVSDYEYDKLEQQLIEMEEAGHPPDPHSPSQVVGGDAADGYPQHIQDFFNGQRTTD